MPNRILRDWTDSPKVERLSADAERLFTRLIMKADDFGRYHADVRLIRAGCFPLLQNLRDTDISHWRSECEQAGMIAVYTVQGREFLAIVNFRQRIREGTSKFPSPEGKRRDWLPDDGHMTVNCQSADGQLLAYTESEAKALAQTKAQAQIATSRKSRGKSAPSEPNTPQARAILRIWLPKWAAAHQGENYPADDVDYVKAASILGRLKMKETGEETAMEQFAKIVDVALCQPEEFGWQGHPLTVVNQRLPQLISEVAKKERGISNANGHRKPKSDDRTIREGLKVNA